MQGFGSLDRLQILLQWKISYHSVLMKIPKQQFYLLRYIDTQIERKKVLKKTGWLRHIKSTRSSLAKFLDDTDIRFR